jgi:predicted nucleic acid-binding protein
LEETETPPLGRGGQPLDPRDARPRAVVDANVVVSYLLGTEPHCAEAERFWARNLATAAPALWEAELVNALWVALRLGSVEADQGLEKLEFARGLGITTVPVHDLWEGAFVLASAHVHPAYDTLYVELAQRLGVPLATFDERLIEKFPGTAVRPGDV